MQFRSIQRRREARRKNQEMKQQLQQQTRDERRQMRESEQMYMHRYLLRLHEDVRGRMGDLSAGQESELFAKLQAHVATQSFAAVFGDDGSDEDSS